MSELAFSNKGAYQQIERVPNRIVIQTIMRNSKEDLDYMIGPEAANEDKYMFSIRFHVRAFLLLISIMNGSFAGLMTSSTKLSSETINSNGSSYAILFFVSLIVLSQIVILCNLNLTMRNYSQLYVTPFYECCAIFFNLISGLVLIGEYELYTSGQLIRILLGCIVSIGGIVLKLQTLEAFDAG